jgi:hypothetical protein
MDISSFQVDTSKKHPCNAGQCTYCGHFKTWAHKVRNPKSGNMMPGHVTADGYLIGNGECPKFQQQRTPQTSSNNNSWATPAPPPPAKPVDLSPVTSKIEALGNNVMSALNMLGVLHEQMRTLQESVRELVTRQLAGDEDDGD